MTRAQTRGCPGEGGAAAVELAIILPVLFLFIAGIVDFGRAFMFQIELTNAAREGARLAVVGGTAAEVDTRAKAAMPTPALPMTVSITSTNVPCSSGAPAQVTATLNNFSWIVLGPAVSIAGGGSSFGPSSLSSSATMQCPG